MGRRSLNHAVDQMRRQQRRVDVLVGLDAPCAVCGHEHGYHRFVTFTLPTPCAIAGCGCQDFKESKMLNPHDPFASMVGEPEAPPSPFAGMDEPASPAAEDHHYSTREIDRIARGGVLGTIGETQLTAYEGISSPVGAFDPDEASTPVRFPVLAAGVKSIPFADLVGPAQRVAEIIEALEPVLAPPAVVEQLQALVTKANGLQVTDAASYKTGCDLYELLAANEKGIEEGEIGNVVRFFYRPWKAFCDFRARHLKPVTEAKKRLSDVCGAWKLEQDKRDKVAAQQLADAAAADERKRLAELAAAATSAAAAAPEGSPVREVLEQAAVQATEQQKHVLTIVPPASSSVPQTETKGRKKYQACIVDLDAFYKALAEDSTRRAAAPIDQAYLNRQANDLGEGEFTKRFPGVEAREKGGLTAGGKR